MAQREPVRYSHLKAIGRSPAHYIEALKGRSDSAAFRRGRIVDTAVLGGEQPTVYDGTRRGKAWDAFQAEHPGADIVSATEYADAQPIIASLTERPEHRAALEILRSGRVKERLFFEWLGRPCSGEPDVAGEFLVDLKTTRNAQPDAFKRDALRYGYHAQLAWYRLGLILSGTQPPAQCYIVAVETAAPYPVTVLRLTERTIDMGERLCRTWLERLIACESANQWPGYAQSIVDFDIETEVELTFEEGTP